MNQDPRLAAADRNLADCIRHLIGHARDGTFDESDGLVLFAGAHNYPGAYCNGLVRLDAAMPADEGLSRARTFFSPRRRGYVLWASDHCDRDLQAAAAEGGFFQRPPETGSPLIMIERPVDEPTGPEADQVVDDEGARDYLAVIADAYGMGDAPTQLVEAIFCSPAAILAPGAAAFVVRRDGKPAAAALGILAGDVLGTMWAATTTEARGQGLGGDCLRRVINWGFGRGARMAVGQSSQMGTPLWERMGFDVVSHYRRYVVPPPR